MFVFDLTRTPVWATGCWQVTDGGMARLASLCNLQTLHLSGSDQVTGEGIKRLASGLRALHTLDLSGCQDVADEGVKVRSMHSTTQRFDVRSMRSLILLIFFRIHSRFVRF